ncbi:YqgU-like beta propeller domain-containing protein [Niallia sp. 03133]|uniref:YqgU-like beta propeller domain-containing protein n=1 Tax=Niallia sp. 03133 TaxID=3458060 RepID=UPI0040450974
MYCLIKRKWDVLFLFFLIFTLVLSGCSPKQKETASEEDEKDMPKKEQKDKSLLPPIKIMDGTFVEVAGWLSDNKIAYVSKTDSVYQVYAYHLFTGKYTKLFETNSEIVNIKISPNLKRILIYTALSDGEGKIVIIDNGGKKLFSASLTSYDADFVWNPFNENDLLVSTFTNDWKSEVFLLTVQQKKLIPLKNTDPFSQWMNNEELAYLAWKKNDVSLYAPIKTKNIQTNNETLHKLTNVFSMHVFENTIFTMSIDPNNIDTAVYSFYQPDFHKTSSVRLPILSKNPNWLVPYCDLKQDVFYTFVPQQSGNADSYKDGFHFISINTRSGEQKNIVEEQIENQPIQLSPKNDWCLYGYYLEKVINIKTGEIISLSNT